MTVSVGVDVGASKTLAVAVADGAVEIVRVRVPTGTGSTGVVTSTVEAVRRTARAAGIAVEQLAGVGVGVPGLVERHSGVVRHAVNLGLDGAGLPLAAELARRLRVADVVVENDVNVAALGAARLLGLERIDLAYLSIGSGLAAGLLIDGQVRYGARGGAGEIGHIPVDTAGPLCSCGQCGCLETLASGSALAREWPGPDGVSPAVSLFSATAAGDDRADRVRARFTQHVAAAVRLLVLTCDVEIVVLGGGVTDAGGPLLDSLVATLGHQARESPFLQSLELSSRVTIVPAGAPVAAVGAALAVSRRRSRAAGTALR